MNTMTFAEFADKILSIMPAASIEQDNEGQIIIYTNMKESCSLLVDIDSED